MPAPGFLAPATQTILPLRVVPWLRLPSTREAGGHLPARKRMSVIGSSHKGHFPQPIRLAWKASGLLGIHPAGIGLLEGGRNSLLESAQQATKISVATSALDRQCNKLAQTALSAKITRAAGETMELWQLSGCSPCKQCCEEVWFPTLAAKTRTRRGWGTQISEKKQVLY